MTMNSLEQYHLMQANTGVLALKKLKSHKVAESVPCHWKGLLMKATHYNIGLQINYVADKEVGFGYISRGLASLNTEIISLSSICEDGCLMTLPKFTVQPSKKLLTSCKVCVEEL